ncbi:MAG: RNA-directed DNA polymerase [Thermoguttaceae bacterium]|nr:RNA-directed DNA polymerase [Thermoguttaceae bacterium]
MSKRYTDYMDEITKDELYEGLLAYGLFTDKLPPVFTSEMFYKYSLNLKQNFSKNPHDYVFFESMRDINIPRAFGIPNPMAYQLLCASLRDNWDKIQKHFHLQTDKDKHKISRIHIRKRKESKSLFNMNYQNWRKDDSPVPDILIGKRYAVSADISTCFPSIYSHSLCWALAGKTKAKKYKSRSMWYNTLDHKCMQMKSGETHGILIGPHASNLLSEIILTVVDKHLSHKWQYIRNIDDYTCYVNSYAEAQQFLKELSAHLRSFDLPLNHKKTKIEELPVASTKHWVRQLNTFNFSTRYGKVDYNRARAYLDASVALMAENGNNAAILNYAIKVLAKKELTSNAKLYCLKTILHMAVIYPYLIPLLEDYVFTPFGATSEMIKDFSQIVYDSALEQENYEAITYILYYSLKYNFDILKLNYKKAISKDSCLFKLFTWLYFVRRGDNTAIKALEQHADLLANKRFEFDRNWIFIYEALPADKLPDEWKPMKEAKISFIKPDFRSNK